MPRLVISLFLAATLFPAAQAASIDASGHLGAGIVRYSGATGSAVTVENELLDAPWIAIKGAEDLGSGNQAIFKLSTSLNLPTGGFSGKFDDTWVGLASQRWGRVTIGRQYPEGINRISDSLDVFEVSGSSIHVLPLALLATNAFAGYTGRADNSVNYRIKTHGGIVAGVSAAAGEVAGVSDSFGLALPGERCELGVAGLHYRGGATAPGGVQYFGGIGGHCDIAQGRVYVTVYGRSLRRTHDGPRQRNLMLHLGMVRRLGERVTLRGGVYLDRGAALGCLPGKDGRKTTGVLALAYAFSPATRLTVIAFTNLMADDYRGDSLNAGALGAEPGTAAVRGAAVTLGISF